ncbi:MAG: quinone-interacting membrane-bound oxidoreductase complex subunit QmoC [bacterium]
MLIKPDLKFIRETICAGGDSLKKCFQCATCSVTCKLSPDGNPFPRKEMIWAQWGLKDKLLADPDIWLCHQCSDCTVYCPRGAKPGEVMAAIRKAVITHYSFPKFLGKMVSQVKYVPLLIAFPVILLLAVLGISGHLNIPAGEIIFSKFMPTEYVDAIFIPVALFAAIVFGVGITRYWKDISGPNAKIGLIPSLISTIVEILTHNRFNKCEVNKLRSIAHLGVFYGFIGLAITTALAVFYLYILKQESPYPLLSPVKIIGNISALTLLIGIILVIGNRLKNKEKTGLGSYFDWSLIVVIAVVVLTGILSQFTRWANITILAYPIYFLHLVSVFYLFIYAPYSKLAHLLYRTAAMVYAKQCQREV